jgi:hypothetical protein
MKDSDTPWKMMIATGAIVQPIDGPGKSPGRILLEMILAISAVAILSGGAFALAMLTR